MCKTRNSRGITLNERTFRVDGCIKDLLLTDGFRKHATTLDCCCGHGRYPKTIIIKSIDGKIREFYTGKVIPRTRRFYKTDGDGYYYIPEISVPVMDASHEATCGSDGAKGGVVGVVPKEQAKARSLNKEGSNG